LLPIGSVSSLIRARSLYEKT